MKILVIGGSGFIGTCLIKKLLNTENDVLNYDRKNSKNYPEKTIIGDIRNSNRLIRVTQYIDLVIHLAAEHEDNIYPTSLYYDVNVSGTQNIIDACVINNINKIIFTSTVALYGLNPISTSEGSIPRPFNDYGKSKLQAEKLLIKWQEGKIDRSLSIIRPTVIFGENNRGNIYALMNQIALNRFMPIGKYDNRKSIAYVGNLVEFILFSLNNNDYNLINYADKPDMTMKKLITLIYKYLGKKENKIIIPYYLGIIIGYFFDSLSFFSRIKFSINSIRIKKFCSDSIINTDKLGKLNFKPSFNMETALKYVINCEFVHKIHTKQ